MRSSILKSAPRIALGAAAVFLFGAEILCGPAILCGAMILFEAATALADAPKAQPAVNAKLDQAAKLVQQALKAEAAGKPAERDALLKQALAIAPDYAPAHWQLGELRSGNGWVSVDDAAKPSAKSAKLEEYRQLRDQAGDTVDEQLNLARWCEKAGLKEQQRAHLMFALELQPKNKEAIAKLGLVRYRGEWLPAAQLDEIKAQVRQSLAESKEWKAKVDAWAKQLSEKPKSVDEIVKQIREIRDPAAIPSLERDFGNGNNLEISKAVIDCLSAMPQQAATESLLRFAVFPPNDEVAKAAMYALRSRSRYSYVPQLLLAMKMPIYVEYDVFQFDAHNFKHQLALFRQGPTEDEQYVRTESTSAYSLIHLINPSIPDETPKGIAATQQTQQRAALSTINRVEHINEQSSKFNIVLAQVLQNTTGENIGADPAKWWSWWADDNEFYEPPQNLVNESSDYSFSYFLKTKIVSCFPAGTAVWTMTGPMQIEKIKVGELVLAQDTESGELAYKPVIGTTIRPASPVIETHVGENVIRATRGHPFWVDGTGWQMAKELKAGEWLHTAQGMAKIDSAEASDEAVCYNLIVADFHDYFVSGAKLLVHDNLLRGPTLATVPGLPEGK